MTINAVIFDIGNVLIRWQPELFYDQELGQARRRALFDAVDLHKMNEAVDAGEELRTAAHRTAQAHPEHAEAIQMWHDRWTDIAAPALDHSVATLKALKARGVPVFVLSNIGTDVFETARAHYDFLNLFDRYFISGSMKVIKPDPMIYEQVEQACGLPPETLLFVDDRPENIAAARACGWQGHVFEKPAAWAACLVEKGLLQAGSVRFDG